MRKSRVWLLCVFLAGCYLDPDIQGDAYYPCEPDGSCLVEGCQCMLDATCVPKDESIGSCVPCKDHQDCLDEDPCTEDKCEGYVCRYLHNRDADLDGFVDAECGGADCRDDLKEVNPEAPEGPYGDISCSDELDNNCDGFTDGYDPSCGCVLDADCDDNNQCTDDFCEGGQCRQTESTDPCNDEDPCTMQDTCKNSVCLGVPLDADGDSHVADHCPDGTDCDDGKVEVHPDASEAGMGSRLCTDSLDNDCDGLTDGSDPDCGCQTSSDCEDQNPCTDDICQENLCQHQYNGHVCTDNDPCTESDHCVQGDCTGDPLDADNDGYSPIVCDGLDCDDQNNQVHPGIPEGPWDSPVCYDGIDNDCDLQIDQEDPACVYWSPVCLPDAWCWENPRPQGNSLFTVWAAGPQDVWLAGTYGTILHFNGSTFEDFSSEPQFTWEGIWGTGPENMWLVGEPGIILHRDMGMLNTIEYQNPDQGVLAIYGIGPDNVWAVGRQGLFLVREAADAWVTVYCPVQSDLLAVWGTGPNDVWAVGFSGTILHYDGFVCQPEEDITFQDLEAVWGVELDRFWVGGQFTLLSFDGANWNPYAGLGGGARIYALHGTSHFNVWAAGANGELYHWDQTAQWNPVATPTLNFLYTLWNLSDDEMWAAGYTGIILQRTGPEIRLRSYGSSRDLKGVWGPGDGSAWAVGPAEEILRRDPLAGVWQPVANPLGIDLRAVWGVSPEDVWAVGANGQALRFDGRHWRPEDTGANYSYHDVWARAADDVWAVGEFGQIKHYDGTDWIDESQGGSQPLFGVWGDAAGTLWVVGGGGTVLRRSAAGGWSSVSNPANLDLKDVWGSGSHLWVVGDGGVILRFNAGGWEEEVSGVTSNLEAIYGLDANTVLASGMDGVILFREPANGLWERILFGTGNTLYGLGGQGNEIWAVGSGGTILRKER